MHFVSPPCVTWPVRNMAIKLQGFNRSSHVTEPNGHRWQFRVPSPIAVRQGVFATMCRGQVVLGPAVKPLHPPPVITLPARTLLSLWGWHCHLSSLLRGESCHLISHRPPGGPVAMLCSLSTLDPACIREDLWILELSKPLLKLISSCPNGMSLRHFWDRK